ncbi:MAG: TIGR03621 family F420-dependent LLM class oxidoreductase [Thermomicrobiales bacterium]|nr:TIGR03621 family F420-dependent LLM class oxidoreductase [Thermomicrobiales bacterium]
MSDRPFRFGVQLRGAGSGREWREKCRRVEMLGYDTLAVADHFPRGLGPFAALATAAATTDRLRVGAFVFANDFRHPAVLAKETATLDLLSEGRLEVGIGAGWLRTEYEATGIPFDRAGVRIDRLAEALPLVKRLWTEDNVTTRGRFYQAVDLSLTPRPVQAPHPPVMVGGGGQRILSLAARHADIVALNPRATPEGAPDRRDITAEDTARKLAWVRAAAGERFPDLELNTVVLRVVPTNDREAAAHQLAQELDLTPGEILESPHLLLGTADEMAATLRQRRNRFGLSYVTVTEDGLEPFAPVMERLGR